MNNNNNNNNDTNTYSSYYWGLAYTVELHLLLDLRGEVSIIKHLINTW